MMKLGYLTFVPVMIGTMVVTQAPVWAESSPQSVVEQFYQWYLANQQNDVRKQFSQQEKAFDPVFYQQLIQAFKKGPPDGDWLDFDPFFNNQMGARSYSLGAVKVLADTAQVTITIRDSRGSMGRPISVMLNKQDGRWRIQDLKYSGGGSLLDILKTINKPSQR